MSTRSGRTPGRRFGPAEKYWPGLDEGGVSKSTICGNGADWLKTQRLLTAGREEANEHPFGCPSQWRIGAEPSDTIIDRTTLSGRIHTNNRMPSPQLATVALNNRAP